MCQFLEREGFQLRRVRGSVITFTRATNFTRPYQYTATARSKSGTIRSILRDIGFSPADFADRLRL